MAAFGAVIVQVLSLIRKLLIQRKNQLLSVNDVECFLEELDGLSPWTRGGLHFPSFIIMDVQFLYHTQGFPQKVLLGMGVSALEIADVVVVRYTDGEQYRVLRISHQALVEFCDRTRRMLSLSLYKHISLKRRLLAKEEELMGYKERRDCVEKKLSELKAALVRREAEFMAVKRSLEERNAFLQQDLKAIKSEAQEGFSSLKEHLNHERWKVQNMNEHLRERKNQIEDLHNELLQRPPRDYAVKQLQEYERIIKEQGNVIKELTMKLSQQEVVAPNELTSKDLLLQDLEEAFKKKARDSRILADEVVVKQREINKLKRDKEELRDDILALQRKVKERESDISALTMGSRLLNTKVSEQEKKISEMNTEKVESCDNCFALQREAKERESDISALSTENKQLVMKVSELETKISEINTEKINAENELENKKIALNDLEEAFNTWNREIEIVAEEKGEDVRKMTPKKEELRDDILALQRKVKERESDISALTMGSKLLDLKVSELEKTISEINTEKLKAERQSENYLSHMRNVETSYRTLTEEVVELRNENAAQAQEIRKLKKL